MNKYNFPSYILLDDDEYDFKHTEKKLNISCDECYGTQEPVALYTCYYSGCNGNNYKINKFICIECAERNN